MKVDQALTKRYYSIGEVSEIFGVSNSLIRYWEGEFSVLRPSKNGKGDRRFTERDIRKLEKIYTLVKERGFTLEGAKKEMKNPTDLSKEEQLQKLTSIRSRLTDMLAKLEDL